MYSQDSKDMENRILEAAKRVFVRKGFEQTSMSDIAHEVGISRTALHYYFRTKQMLFEAIFGQLMKTLLPNIKKIVDRKETILEKIPHIIDVYSNTLSKNLLFPIFMVNEMNRDPEHLYQTILKEPELTQPILQLKKQIEDEMKAGLIKKIPVMDIIAIVVGGMIFPLLIRNPLSAIFLNGNEELFMQHIPERTELIKQVALQLLTPNDESNI